VTEKSSSADGPAVADPAVADPALPDAAGSGEQESDAVRALRAKFGDAVLAVAVNRGQWRVTLEREVLCDAVILLRDTPNLGFTFNVDVTCLDHYGEEPRFRALYVLRSMASREDIVLKVRVPEEDCWAPSITPLFPGANVNEREAYDMFGVKFRGHPDLRRIMMPEIFEDWPLRSDFPMEGKMSDQEWAEWIIGRAQRLEGHD
jgi:NADH-quinone oxidoreductase subunit C